MVWNYSTSYIWGKIFNRRRLTYINALAKAGFAIEQLIEETDKKTMESDEDDSDKAKKARMLPISVCFKARKL